MKRLAVIGLCGFLGLAAGVVTMSVAQDASAQTKKKKAAKGAPAAPASATKAIPTVRSKMGIELTPAGIRWGMTPELVVKFYDRVIEKDYAPLYKKAQPGPQTERLDAAVASAKDAFRRSRVEFGKLPTGMDSTPLKDEYSYQNGESMMKINRRGSGTRYFFFMRDKLWKIYDELSVGPKRPIGPDFETLLKKMSGKYKVSGRTTEPDYAIGRNYTEVDWQDDRSRLRAIDRTGMKVIGIVYEDRSVLENLDSLRTAKPVDVNQVDPEVEALIRPIAPPAGPPEEPAKDASKKKKKGGR